MGSPQSFTLRCAAITGAHYADRRHFQDGPSFSYLARHGAAVALRSVDWPGPCSSEGRIGGAQ